MTQMMVICMAIGNSDKADCVVNCAIGLDHGVHDRVFWCILKIVWAIICIMDILVRFYVYVSCEKLISLLTFYMKQHL